MVKWNSDKELKSRIELCLDQEFGDRDTHMNGAIVNYILKN